MKHSYLSLFSFRNPYYLPHSFNVKHHFGFKARTDFFVVNILHKIKICKLILTTKNTNHYCVEIDIALQREINLWLDTKYCLFKHTYTHLNKILVPPKCQIIIISKTSASNLTDDCYSQITRNSPFIWCQVHHQLAVTDSAWIKLDLQCP